jgi:uncharacterized protein
MSPDVQEAYVRQLLEAHGEGEEVVVAWQGGEPTLIGLDFFRRAIALERAYARPGQRILNTLQTNGTLLDDAWAEFLAQNGFLVGISIDGPPDVHDAYRRSKGGRPTFERVLRGLEHLKAHHVEWNVLTTVHAANGDQGRRVYTFLRDELGARFIQFLPIVESAGASPSVGPEQYGRFLIEVFEEWVRRDIGRVYVQIFDSALASWVGMPASMCVHSDTCGLQLIVESGGDLYCCDHFVDPDNHLGNITQAPLRELVASPERARFGAAKRATLSRHCRDCDVLFACRGGCPKDRFATAPDGEGGQHYLCPSYRAFFHHVAEPMSAMADLLAHGRAPAELMHLRS